MRIEKGHAAGNELNGQTTAGDLRLGKMVSKKKDSIGSVLSEREGLIDPKRLVLVGVMPCNSEHKITSGSHIFAHNFTCIPDNDLGYITSMAYSPTLNSYIGLAMLKNGADRFGEKLRAVNLLQNEDIEIQITSPHFYDPKGERLRG
jgi:sarcosine oxidase subunit alpha